MSNRLREVQEDRHYYILLIEWVEKLCVQKCLNEDCGFWLAFLPVYLHYRGNTSWLVLSVEKITATTTFHQTYCTYGQWVLYQYRPKQVPYGNSHFFHWYIQFGTVFKSQCSLFSAVTLSANTDKSLDSPSKQTSAALVCWKPLAQCSCVDKHTKKPMCWK